MKVSDKNKSVEGKIKPNCTLILRQKLPLLSFQEVRRLRIPLHEALLLELTEGGFKNAASFFNILLHYDQEQQNGLMKDEQLLEQLFNQLMETEFCTKETEIEILLELARKSTSIHWLADKIYSRTFTMLKVYELEDTRLDASLQYFYGKFLSNNTAKLQEAASYLDVAYTISYGVDDWLLKDDLAKTEKLYVLARYELCKSLNQLSEMVREDYPEEALAYANKSLKILRRCRQQTDRNLEVDTELAIGQCFMEMQSFEKALMHLEMALWLSKSNELKEQGITALMKIFECNKRSNDDDKIEETLDRARAYAAENLLASKEGDILVMHGQYCVKRGDFARAQNYFKKAAEVFENICETRKLQKARFLLAPIDGKHFFSSAIESISTSPLSAQKAFNGLVTTILKSDKATPGRNPYLARLILWHDRKCPIFQPHNESFQPEEEDEEVEAFVKKYLDPNEITQVADDS